MSLLNDVLINKKTSINPIWIMRQAGRYLPEFREIRSKNTDFIKLCLNPDLSSEITLQPLKRFDLDASINAVSSSIFKSYFLEHTAKFHHFYNILIRSWCLFCIGYL